MSWSANPTRRASTATYRTTPKNYDSRSYPAADGNLNGGTDKALAAAKSDYFQRLSAFYVGAKTRVMWTVMLTQADGRTILRESMGAFPDMTPPAQEPEEPEPPEA